MPIRQASCRKIQPAVFYSALGESRGKSFVERTGKAVINPVSAISKGDQAITDNMEDLLAAVASTQDRDAFHSLFEYSRRG